MGISWVFLVSSAWTLRDFGAVLCQDHAGRKGWKEKGVIFSLIYIEGGEAFNYLEIMVHLWLEVYNGIAGGLFAHETLCLLRWTVQQSKIQKLKWRQRHDNLWPFEKAIWNIIIIRVWLTRKALQHIRIEHYGFLQTLADKTTIDSRGVQVHRFWAILGGKG